MKSALLLVALFALITTVVLEENVNLDESWAYNATADGSWTYNATTDGSWTYDYAYDAQCVCPVKVLEAVDRGNWNPPGCTYMCGNHTCTIPDGYPCVDMSLQEFSKMQVNVTQPCSVGICHNGTCVTDGQRDNCFKPEQ